MMGVTIKNTKTFTEHPIEIEIDNQYEAYFFVSRMQIIDKYTGALIGSVSNMQKLYNGDILISIDKPSFIN